MTTPQQAQLERLERQASQLREAIREVQNAKGIAVSPNATGVMVSPSAKHLPAVTPQVSQFIFANVRDHLLQALARELEQVDLKRNEI